jgi:NADH dehydrogenase
MSNSTEHRVVVIGGGFGGLYATQALRRAPVQVTLIDKHNYHLFQPLLYQVATGIVSPADIASPLRGILSRQKNTEVLLGDVQDIDPDAQQVILRDRRVDYDSLIVATGVSHHYFGNDHWHTVAPGLKTIEDALEIRRRVFKAFEMAEHTSEPEVRQAWMTFVLVGGGPTGVELAGAIAELAHHTLVEDFRHIDTRQAQILLIEGLDRVLPPYAPDLSANAQAALEKLGVRVKTNAMVTDITPEQVTVRVKATDTDPERLEMIPSKTVLWAAGVRASNMGQVLAERTGAALDRPGRVIVNPDLSVSHYKNIFVIGDLAHFNHQSERPLPGIAPVAMQEGQYVANLIQARLRGQELAPLQYKDHGNLAVIGRNAAVVDLGFVKLTGFIAWLAWVFAHIYYLIEFDNKLIVMLQWGWSYVTQNRGARLITGETESIFTHSKVHVPAAVQGGSQETASTQS